MRRSLPASAILALTLSACLVTTREPDCLLDGTCECKVKADCPDGKDCVNGHCFEMPDAGLAGDLGWPCQADAECLFGPCLPKGPGNGGVCSAHCALEGGVACGKGYECKSSALAAVGGLCAPPMRALCLGCQTDSDCNAIGDHCLALDGGQWCGQDCTYAQCPGGYSCRSVLLDAGVARQCVPDTMTCECSVITVGLERSCKQTNAVGTCFGFEVCRADGGWAGCDARLAARERCNGLDDDCNGLTDQADPGLDVAGLTGFPDCKKGLACTGKWSCQPLSDGGAAFSCSAPDPVDEVCNGRDDDCDGVVDNGLIDGAGRYVSVHACGACNNDCFTVLQNLARDGGVDGGIVPGAASCVDRSGALTCVPNHCQPGYFPSPPAAATVCEKAITSQCRPCTAQEDCVVPGDQCTTLGTDPGSACLQACDVTAAYAGCTGVVGQQGCCPPDSLCQDLAGKKLCIPTGNSCVCNPSRLGLTRSCFKTLGGDTCVGQQTCSDGGSFGVCDTSRTAIELCDGRDNDCNGIVDDPFINTRGSGTYDTDQHCGTCSTDCTARWSPTIQHAIGGCTVQRATPPSCAIVQCTTGTVPGGGQCRVDADCGAGRTCSPTYFQCVKACTGTGQGTCASGEQCVDNSFCTRACTAAADCTAAYGPLAACVGQLCVSPYQFVNADHDDTNGCECAAPTGAVDVPDTSATYPVAGMPYVDRNCDGVDGDGATSLYVWAQAAVGGNGTRTRPLRTITQAIAAWTASGGRSSAILVAQGTYVEQVVLANGVKIYGGYSADFFKHDVITYPTLIEAAEPNWAVSPVFRGTVSATNLSATTELSGFTIRGYDVTSRPAVGEAAKSSYGVYVSNSPGLVLRNNHVVGGRGADATPANPGVAGNNGGLGVDGVNARECASTTCGGETQSGGAGATNSSCGGQTAGHGGSGSDPNLDPQGFASNAGGDGLGGSNAVYAHSAPSQNQFCKYDCTVPQNGLNGQAAENGSDGLPNQAAQGCTQPVGAIAGTDWATVVGGPGSSGGHGRGGGGGGAGGCVRNDNPSTCTIGHLVGDLGATGGGGGAGGCGGTGGLGAAGGGGSFAIFVIGAAPRIEGNLIDLGFGGFGGAGGAGGYGGLGGQGGRGGAQTTLAWCAGLGGPGGRGGNGGAGTGGGGGCGGSAFGVAGNGVSAAGYATSNTFAPVPVNAAGLGGLGGASPAGPTFKGGDGQSGVVAKVQDL